MAGAGEEDVLHDKVGAQNSVADDLKEETVLLLVALYQSACSRVNGCFLLLVG